MQSNNIPNHVAGVLDPARRQPDVLPSAGLTLAAALAIAALGITGSGQSPTLIQESSLEFGPATPGVPTPIPLKIQVPLVPFVPGIKREMEEEPPEPGRRGRRDKPNYPPFRSKLKPSVIAAHSIRAIRVQPRPFS